MEWKIDVKKYKELLSTVAENHGWLASFCNETPLYEIR